MYSTVYLSVLYVQYVQYIRISDKISDIMNQDRQYTVHVQCVELSYEASGADRYTVFIYGISAIGIFLVQ